MVERDDDPVPRRPMNRTDRVAASLRANLARRKERARALRQPPPTTAAGDPALPTTDEGDGGGSGE